MPQPQAQHLEVRLRRVGREEPFHLPPRRIIDHRDQDRLGLAAALEAAERNHPVEKVGRALRRLMPFIDAKEV